MSESDATFDLIGKHHKALADKIVQNAWRLAGDMVVGRSTLQDGVFVPAAYLTLKELELEVTREIPR